MRRGTVSSTFWAWKDAALDDIEARLAVAQKAARYEVIITQALARMMKRKLAMTFDGWRAAVMKRRRRRLVIDHVLRRIRHQGMYQAWAGWQDYVLDRKWFKKIGAKIRRRWLHLEVAMSWDDWSAHVETRKHGREVLGQMFASRQRREMIGPWRVWSPQSAANLAAKRTEHLLRSFMAKMKNLLATRTMNQWRGVVEERIRLEHKAALYLQHWRGRVARRAERFFKITRSVNRMKKRSMTRAYLAWVAHAERRRELRHIGTRVVLRWQRRQAAACMDGWLEFVDNTLACRELLRRIVQRRENTMMQTAMTQWGGSLESPAEKANRRKELAVMRFMGRSTQGRLYCAWLGWIDVARLWKRLRFFVQKMRHKQLSKATEAWWDFVDTLKAQRAVFEDVLDRLHFGRLKSGFEAFSVLVHPLRQMAHNRRCIFAARFGKKLENKAMRTYFDMWCNKRNQARQLREIGVRFGFATAATFFHSWMSFVELRAEQRKWLFVIAQRWRISQVAMGMRMWICFDRFMERANPAHAQHVAMMKQKHARRVDRYLHVPIVAFLDKYRHIRAHFLAWIRFTRATRRRYRQKIDRAARRLKDVSDAWEPGDIDKYVAGAAWQSSEFDPTQNMSLTESIETAAEGSTSPEFHKSAKLRRLKLKRGKVGARRKGLKSSTAGAPALSLPHKKERGKMKVKTQQLRDDAESSMDSLSFSGMSYDDRQRMFPDISGSASEQVNMRGSASLGALPMKGRGSGPAGANNVRDDGGGELSPIAQADDSEYALAGVRPRSRGLFHEGSFTAQRPSTASVQVLLKQALSGSRSDI